MNNTLNMSVQQKARIVLETVRKEIKKMILKENGNMILPLPVLPMTSNTAHTEYFNQPPQKSYNRVRKGIVDSDTNLMCGVSAR